MKLIGLKRLAGLALAAVVIGGPLAGSAIAQTAAAPARRCRGGLLRSRGGDARA